MRIANVAVTDWIRVEVSGLDPETINNLVTKYSYIVKGARYTAAYKVGAWDGKRSLVYPINGETIWTYSYIAKDVLSDIKRRGYKIKITSYRNETVPEGMKPIDEHYLADYGITLRDIQVKAINAVIRGRRGHLNLATASGKTLVTATIAKYYEPYGGSLIIVPSNILVEQTYNDCKMIGLDVGRIGDGVFETGHKHIVGTWQSIIKNDLSSHNFATVQVDECHAYASSHDSIIGNQLVDLYGDIPIRVSLTGTLPKTKYERLLLNCRIGGDVISMTKPKEIIEKGYASTVEISMTPVRHHVEIVEDYNIEQDYYTHNDDRLGTIVEYIRKLQEKYSHILVLTHPRVGIRISGYFGDRWIDKDTTKKQRIKYITEMDNKDKYILTASYGTVGTGVSMKRINCLVLVDVGKNETRIVQSIGRGMRLDGRDNHVVVYDIYSELYTTYKGERVYYGYGLKHSKQRMKIYKQYKYHYYQGDVIEI